MKPINHTARFETVGDLYYRHSGRLRPGKSEPPETNRDSSSPENRAAFDEWCATLCFGQALDRIADLESKIEKLETTIDESPCAITDSDVAASPESSQEAERSPDRAELTAENCRRGDTPVDDMVGDSGSGETSPVTAGAIPVAGASDRFLLCYESGALKWMGSIYESRAAADETIALTMRMQAPGFADRYRVQRLAVVSPGEWVPFVGLGQTAEETEASL